MSCCSSAGAREHLYISRDIAAAHFTQDVKSARRVEHLVFMKAYLAAALSLPRAEAGRVKVKRRPGSVACLVLASTTELSSHSAVAYLENFEKKEKIFFFKSVPLSTKLQPCIFNFLLPYNVIHWHPSQTRGPLQPA